MKHLNRSIRTQIILVTLISLLVLAGILEITHQYQQQAVLTNTERRVGLTLIRSVNNTINSVRAFISSLSDIAELDTRLTELVQLNTDIDFIAVTDATGLVIFHSDHQYQGQQVSGLSAFNAQETIAKEVTGFGKVFLTALPFASEGLADTPQYWIIVASAAEPIQNQRVNSAFASALVTLILTLTAGFFLIIFLQAYFVRPLEQLTKATNAIEAGDLTIRVQTRQNNEIGQLARSFNQMTQQLASLINTLEERVKARTVELEIARDQAEQASRAKSDFLSNMSHELRTPLNMVIGYTSSMLTMPEMYNQVELPAVFRNDIELIRQSGKHLLVLINDILDLSKVEAGKLTLNCTAVDLKPLLDSVVAASLGLIGAKPLQLRSDYPDKLPLIWADTMRVRQILLNLLSNGIKYTASGSVTLTAEVRAEQVRIAVTDTGAGIPESALNTIFDRFEQLQTDTDIQGTGLGLDISQRLAQLHGSHITIDSQIGQGSTFAFTLPLATAEQISKTASDPGMSDNAEVFSGAEELRQIALVVAADPSTRQLFRSILDAAQIVMLEAVDGQNGFELASGVLPDLIIWDTSIETTDHQQWFDQLRNNAETRTIPRILIQAGAEVTAPADQPVIYKPLTAAHITPVIQAVLGNRKA
ncbi:MAG TPA: ATP-binding protein [Phototrophicaceae bacterium]|nr:ATP-binding protein [Phototrophicaceae bacterium]